MATITLTIATLTFIAVLCFPSWFAGAFVTACRIRTASFVFTRIQETLVHV